MTPNDQQQRDRLAEINRQLSELYKQLRQLEQQKRQLEHNLSIPTMWTLPYSYNDDPPRWSERDEW